MLAGECCNRTAFVCTPATGIEQAARLMRQHHVGTLVVVAETDRPYHPVGLVTDRDLVLEVLAEGVAPADLTIGDIMHRDLLVAGVEDGLWETLHRMRARGVRRVPVSGCTTTR